MKRVIVFIAVLITMALFSTGCGSTAHETAVRAVKQGGICSISVDPKIELLGVVQYLADDPNIMKNDSQYSKEILNNFSKYKDEPVIGLYKDMRAKGFSYDIPPRSMLYIDGNFKITNNITLPEDIVNKAGGKDKLQKFFDLLFDFRKKSEFDQFYKGNTDYYNEIVSGVNHKIESTGCIEKLVEYYGYKQSSFNIIIQPLSIGGYAGRMPAKDGTFDIYDFMVVPDNLPEFCNLLLHEFGHSYVNPLTEQNINEVYSCSNLFDPIKESMTRQAYGGWDFCVNEHVVRSVTYSILNEIFGAGVSQDYLKQDAAKDFIYIDELSERLGEYESNRNKYPSFKDFYPRILDVFKDISRNK